MNELPKKYHCRRIAGPLDLDGFISDPAWQDIPWTDDFEDITGDPALKPRFRTRAKMAWDDDCLLYTSDAADD